MSSFDNWVKTIRVACDSIAQDEAKPYKVLRCDICNKFVSEYEYYLQRATEQGVVCNLACFEQEAELQT